MSTLRDRLERLNGWQRLWLLATAAWLVGVVVIIVQAFPTEERLRSSARDATHSLYRPLLESVQSDREACKKLVSAQKYLDASACFKSNHEAAMTHQQMIDDAVKKQEARIDGDLLYIQSIAIAKAVGLWIVPSIILYLLGYVIAWALKGFRKPANP